MLQSRVESGDILREQYNADSYRWDAIVDDIWQGALATAMATENEVGKDQLGSGTDYELGHATRQVICLR